MKFRVFATRFQPSPPPSPMRLEITLVEERAASPQAVDVAAYSRSFDHVERVLKVLANSDLEARYRTTIMTTCDRAMREWNLAKSSDTLIDIDRKQLRDLDFIEGRPPVAS